MKEVAFSGVLGKGSHAFCETYRKYAVLQTQRNSFESN